MQQFAIKISMKRVPTKLRNEQIDLVYAKPPENYIRFRFIISGQTFILPNIVGTSTLASGVNGASVTPVNVSSGP